MGMNDNPILVLVAFFALVFVISSAMKKNERDDALQDAVQQTVNLLKGLVFVAVLVGFLLVSGLIAR